MHGLRIDRITANLRSEHKAHDDGLHVPEADMYSSWSLAAPPRPGHVLHFDPSSDPQRSALPLDGASRFA